MGKEQKITPGGSANKAADQAGTLIAGLQSELTRFKVETEHALADAKSTTEALAARVDSLEKTVAGLKKKG